MWLVKRGDEECYDDEIFSEKIWENFSAPICSGGEVTEYFICRFHCYCNNDLSSDITHSGITIY
jgi:hypothetical protein